MNVNAFFRTSIASRFTRATPVESVSILSSWDAAMKNALVGVDGVLLDSQLAGSPSMAQRVRILRPALVRTVVVAPDRSHPVMNEVVDANTHGVLFRTDPVDSLTATLEHPPGRPQVAVPGPAGVRTLRLARHQCDVVAMYGSGLTLPGVAARMGLSRHTVEMYLKEARTTYEKAAINIRTTTRLSMHTAGRQHGAYARSGGHG